MISKEDRMSCSVHLSEDERSVVILDQTQLPNRQVLLTLNTTEELCDAIRRLAVRGAPAIGIFAGYGLYVLAEANVECHAPPWSKRPKRLWRPVPRRST